MKQESYHEKLQNKMDDYVHLVYSFTKQFPKEELYGTTSQLRRSALSTVLNYIEGYARGREKVRKHFLEISFGSLKESRYLIEFSFKESFISKDVCDKAVALADEIGAMVWGILRKL